jgi:tight adherence protein B
MGWSKPMLLYAILPALVLLIGALIITSAFLMTPNKAVEIDRRIGLVSAHLPAKPSAAAASSAEKQKGPVFDVQVRRIFTLGAPHRWGMKASGAKLLLISIIAGIITLSFVLRAIAPPVWAAVIAGIVAAYLVPRGLLKKQQRRAENQFMDRFPDAIDTIVRMLRAGLPMTSAMRVVSEEGEPPVNEVFGMIADQVGIGISFEQALDAAGKYVGLEDFRFFAVAVLLQYSAGGNVAATLEMLSGIMRKRRAVRMKAKSATAEIRLTGYVLGSLPFFVLGILLIIQPGYLDPLFADQRGHVILGMAVGLLTLSFVTMRQMMQSVTK